MNEDKSDKIRELIERLDSLLYPLSNEYKEYGYFKQYSTELLRKLEDKTPSTTPPISDTPSTTPPISDTPSATPPISDTPLTTPPVLLTPRRDELLESPM